MLCHPAICKRYEWLHIIWLHQFYLDLNVGIPAQDNAVLLGRKKASQKPKKNRSLICRQSPYKFMLVNIIKKVCFRCECLWLLQAEFAW